MENLKRQALIFVWIGEIWNAMEVAIALLSGIGSGSVALIAFGLDSIIELFAGAVLIWRLQASFKAKDEEAAEKKALKLVGISYFVLAGYVILHSAASLLGFFPEPKTSFVGIFLVIASAVVMTALYFKKISLAKKLNSQSLKAEAKQALFCDLQDLPVLIGLGANALIGWWWADPLVALALIPLIVKEGREAFQEKECC
jgi:divalent metal cation (Fe/Co/Zn/Cd) transporter